MRSRNERVEDSKLRQFSPVFGYIGNCETCNMQTERNNPYRLNVRRAVNDELAYCQHRRKKMLQTRPNPGAERERIMPIAYKLVREDFSSLSYTYGQVIYGTDWQMIPGNGAYCSANGTGITLGGIGPRLIRLEVKDETHAIPAQLLNGVQRWHYVRRLNWVPTPKQQTYLNAALAKWDAALAKWDAALAKYKAAGAKYKVAGAKWDAALAQCERLIISVIADAQKGENNE